MSGYIKLHRGVADNPLWEKEPFSSAQAWIDLILAANFKDKTIYIRKTKFEVKRGQLAWSMLTMARRWKWSRGKVIRFLKDLESEHMIVQQTGHLTTVITICNYEKYQGFDTTDDTTGDTTRGTTGSTTDGTQHKNVKKGKNNYTADFELAWAEYPKREGGNPKPSAFKAWNARLNDGHGANEIIEGVRRYARFCRAKGWIAGPYVKQASSFFGPDLHFQADWAPAKPSAIPDPMSSEPAITAREMQEIMRDVV